jgi:hypothetical protein
MSDFENPYKSPETTVVPEKTQDAGTVLTETMLGYLKEASPWLRFIGILQFIGCGIMCVGGIIFAITTSAVSSMMEGMVNFPIWLLSLIYVAAGALFFFPALFTYNFGAKIRNYQLSNSNEDLELAFKNNKSLWKFYGILLIIYLALIPLFIILAVIIGIVAATGLLN